MQWVRARPQPRPRHRASKLRGSVAVISFRCLTMGMWSPGSTGKGGACLVWCCAATGGGAPSLIVLCVHCISYQFNSFNNCIVGQGLGIARKAAVGKTKALPWQGQTLNIIMEQVTYFLKPQLSQLLKWGWTPHGVGCGV